MNVSKAIWSIPLIALMTAPALAGRYYDDGHHHNRFEHRLDRQHWRIKQGVRSGELTRREAKRLRTQQRHISKMERAFSRDGRLNRNESRTLRRELNDASGRIYDKKHNNRYRGNRHHFAPKHNSYYSHRQRAAPDYYHYQPYVDDGWVAVFKLWDRF